MMLAAAAVALGVSCAGQLMQGGAAVCQTAPGAAVVLDGAIHLAADASGRFVIGFDRDARPTASVRVRLAGEEADALLAIAPRTWLLQRVDGLPQQTVTPTNPEVLAQIKADTALKQAAFASQAPGDGFAQAWRWPLPAARVSGPFGSARVLNGAPGQPHYGIDLAAPVGTAVAAPADGIVTLAQTGMHYEGGLVFIDHGQGFTSMYLHMSEVEVKPGQRLAAGERIGAVGATGRATGPHLCWRLKWRGRNLDPSLLPVDALLSP